MKEVVPVRQEREDGHGGQRRLSEWQQDMPQDLPAVCPIDDGRFVQITWYLQKELAHEEHAEGPATEPRRDDERPPRVNPRVPEQRLWHVVEHQELGDDDHFFG